MEWWQAFWLGLTQGLTEFIPVSSSGHLELVQEIMGGRSADFHLFLEFINFGTLLALLIFFRKRIIEICKDVFVRHDWRLALNILITTIPAALAGMLLSDFISEAPFFSSLVTIAAMMALIGCLMIFVDRLPKMNHLRDENKLTKPRALIVGLAQALALVPGTSRSGVTMIAGRMVGLGNKAAANYSFLASIPIMCGVIAKSFLSSSSRAYMAANLGTLIFSNVVAFIAGVLAIGTVMQILQKRDSLKAFGYYRIVLATIIIIFALLQ